jgi:CheY-like chemotaxis protein
VQADEESVNILFTDSGRGISQDFLAHGLFKLFSQQDPLDRGLGLGLPLVQRAVRNLGGSIKFDSDESTGSEVQVFLPRRQLASSRHDSLGQAASSSDPWKTQIDNSDLSDVQLFFPAQWRDQADPRNARSMRAMAESLDHTFHSWFGIRCKNWEAEGEKSKVLLILDTDLQHAREALGDTFLETWKIVICQDSRLQSEWSELGTIASVTGSLDPFKLRAALLTCHKLQSDFEHYVQKPSIETDCSPSCASTPSAPDVVAVGVNNLTESPTVHLTVHDVEEPLQKIPTLEAKDEEIAQREPRFLLVDDNAINLKVIGMFAKKCSKEPFTLAAGGQEAIDAFKTTQTYTGDQSSAPQFDIVMLDLSMPEVSGFEVASTIRSIEKGTDDQSRTYIAALTGLVSEKDRNAAFAAGVDEYVTKPASIRDLISVVSNWRKAIPTT